MDDVVVTTIGTCRIADPVSAAERFCQISRTKNNVYGFVHTSKEALQQIDFQQGRQFPEWIWPYLSAKGTTPTYEAEQPDLYMVEISSTKELVHGDWYLQINYLERQFHNRQDLVDAMSSLGEERDMRTRLRRFERIASFASVTDHERDILLNTHIRRTSEDELKRDMAAIVERLDRPVLFVCHINVPGPRGLIQSRAQLCGQIADICRAQGYRFFDPAPSVLDFGPTRALAENGRDLNHYARDYKPVLGGIMFEVIRSHVFGSRAQAAAEPSKDEPTTMSAALGLTPGQSGAIETGGLPRPDAAQVSAAVAEAKKKIADGDLDGAESVLRFVMGEEHRSPAVHTLAGTIAFHRGDTPTAAAEFGQALELDPTATEPRIMLIKSALRVSRLTEACNMAAELIRVAPNDGRALLVSAKAFMKDKRYADATPVWRRLAASRPDQTGPLLELARCEMKAKNFEEALAAANEVLARDPADGSGLVIKAGALKRLKRMAELAEVSLKLAVIDPKAAMASVPALVSAFHPEDAASIIAAARRSGEDDVDAVMKAGLIQTLERRARVASERSDLAAAAAAWKAVLQIDPENFRAEGGLRKLLSPLVSEARTKIADGDLTGAIAAYRAALAIQPDHEKTLKELATTCEKAGDWLAASDAWVRLADASSSNPDALRRGARAAVKAERFDLAVSIYGRMEPDSATTEALSSTMRKLIRSMREDFVGGRLDEAAEKAKVVATIEPDNEPARRILKKVMSNYSRLLREAAAENNLEAQERIGRKMLELEPDRRDALVRLAKIYGEAKRHRESIEVLSRLTEVEPAESSHWLKLARSCRAVRQYDQGVPAALKALEMQPGDLATVNLLSDMLNRQAVA